MGEAPGRDIPSSLCVDPGEGSINVIESYWHIPLAFLSYLYGAATRLRNYLYDHGVFRISSFEVPVICVGNLTAGGNGKTPLCRFLIERLVSKGFRPVLLSRGYGGTERGPRRIDAECDAPAQVGDEPLLLARLCKVPVYVARSRVAGVTLITRDGAGDVVILDDGFQHRALARDLNIVSVFSGSEQSVNDFVQGRLLPWGRFREDRDGGLARADAVILSSRSVTAKGTPSAPVDQRLISIVPPSLPLYTADLESDQLQWLDGRGEVTRSTTEPDRVFAFAAIAQPEGFFASLSGIGLHVVGCQSFPDHHHYTEAEIRELAARHPGAILVCTEKDGVKLAELPATLRALIAVLPVKMRVIPEEQFVGQVLGAISRGKSHDTE